MLSKTLQHIRVFYNNSCDAGQFGLAGKFGSSTSDFFARARVRSPPRQFSLLFFFQLTTLQMLHSLLINLCECTTIPCYCTASPPGNEWKYVASASAQ